MPIDVEWHIRDGLTQWGGTHMTRNLSPVEQGKNSYSPIAARLRELGKNVEVSAPLLDEHERELLSRYVDRFNARDFDALRTMLTEDVQLDIVGQVKQTGVAKISSRYFYTYNHLDDWRVGVGQIEGRLAVLVYDTAEQSSQPAYFILLTWKESRVSVIRDYRFARYVMRDVQIGS